MAAFKSTTSEDAAFPVLLGSCNSQRIPRIVVLLLSSSIHRRIWPGLYFVGAACSMRMMVLAVDSVVLAGEAEAVALMLVELPVGSGLR